MALVNPNIAMSYRPTVEYQPRNALAEYAQIQQIMGGQRQAEVADMQLEQLRRDRDALSQIQAAIVAKGGPPDLAAAADAMIKSGKPEYLTQGMAIRQKLKDQEAFAAYEAELRPKAPAASPVAEPFTFSADAAQRRASALGPMNALAAPAASAAPANAMVSQPDVAALEARYRRVAGLDTPGAKAEAALLLKQIERSATATPADIKTMQALGYPLTRVGFEDYRRAQMAPQAAPSMVAEYTFAKTPDGGNFKGTYQEFVTARAAAGRAPQQPVAPTITTIEDPTAPGKFLQVDARTYRGGGAGSPGVIGGARPSAATEKARAQREQLGKDLTTAITELKDITKDGGLIDQSTGSGAGRLVDIGARFIGQAMPGDIAIGKIAPIADLALKMVPRFEGPQSDKDTASYKQAAGQLADSSLPANIRKEAGRTVLRLMENRKGQFVTSDMAAEGTTGGGAAAGGGVDTNNPLLK
jgi:hypothetical protein